jgi:hypothetical protein
MTTTLEEVREYLDADEPDYREASRLGPDVLPHLRRLAEEEDPGLASKAVALASILGDYAAIDVLAAAARREEREPRVAAAACIGNLPIPMEGPLADHPREGLLDAMLEDSDQGVRRLALKSLATIRSNTSAAGRLAAETPPVGDSLRRKVKNLAQSDPAESVRALARRTLTDLER